MLRLIYLLLALFTASNTSAFALELQASVELDRVRAHVNEQILVTVRVAAPAVAFKVTKPYLPMDNVDLYALHKREYDQTIDGSIFKVSEIVYALFIQQEGEHIIPPLPFKATLPVSAQRASSNPIISAETTLQRIQITPPPVSAATWLPAQSVSISSAWTNGNNTQVRAGEPAKRIISIHIKGQHPAAIPNMTMPDIDGVKSYADLAKLVIDKSTTGLGGIQSRSVAMILEDAGSVSLPALSLDWWDINDRTWKQASLAAQTMMVQSASTSVAWVRERNRYRLALLLLFATALSLALLSAFLWRKRHSPVPLEETQGAATTSALSEKAAWSRLRRSLKQKNPAPVRQALLVWARVRWPALGITQLDQFDRIDSHLASSAHELNNSLYAKDSKPEIDYGAFMQVLVRLRKAETRNASQFADELSQKLYPDTRES